MENSNMIDIRANHFELTAALKQHTLTKLEKVIKHFDQIIKIKVLFSRDHPSKNDKKMKAEVTLHIKGKDIFIEKSGSDLYATIDTLIDNLDQQVLHYKKRLQDHSHQTLKHQMV